MATTKSPADVIETVAKKPAVRKAVAKTKAVIDSAQDGADAGAEAAGSFASKAGDKAREYANVGKDKASGALGGISELVDTLAKSIDDKVGSQYGDYARRASSAVSGVADALKSKDVDDLVNDARTFIREKPAVAIGAAAAIGFVLTRLAKAGSTDRDDA